jgi:hypothetical protein
VKATHLEILVEEPSMEAFLRQLLPRLLGDELSFSIYPYQCKDDLLAKLPQRMNGYASWLPADWRIIVIVDRDDDDCNVLKKRLERMALDAGLSTRTACVEASRPWQVVNRIVIEELEAWYFGEWNCVRRAYPRVNASVPNKAAYRDPDVIAGGTWEALERVLKKAGYFQSGLRKIELAREMGRCMDWTANCSHSFCVFRDALLEAFA